MNKSLAEKINATIKLNFIPWGEYPDKMNVLSASGDTFDICFSAGWRNYTQMVSKGAYADLSELMPKYASQYMAEMPSYVIDAAKVKGKLYAAPNLQGLR
jgi:ABC-type sugar transport system, periplasmic component